MKSKKDSVKAIAAARGGRESSKTIIGVIVIAAVAVVVIGGVLLTRPGPPGPAPLKPVAADFPAHREGTSVVAGKPGAKTSIDIYEDFMCPACGQVEQGSGDAMAKAIQEGKLSVRYHPVPFLDKNSNPPGYSRNAANAALCAADAGKFASFHKSLFASQPPEGGAGHDKSSMIDLGKKLGINDPSFAQCVNNGKYDQQIEADFKKDLKDPKLQSPQGGFGTPTIIHNGKQVTPTQGDAWLQQVLAQDK